MPSTEVSHANDAIGTAARIPFHPILNRARLLERKAGNNNRADIMSFGYKSTSSEDSAICGWQDKCAVKAQTRSLWMSQAKVNIKKQKNAGFVHRFEWRSSKLHVDNNDISSRIKLWLSVNVISQSLVKMAFEDLWKQNRRCNYPILNKVTYFIIALTKDQSMKKALGHKTWKTWKVSLSTKCTTKWPEKSEKLDTKFKQPHLIVCHISWVSFED